MVRRSKNWAVTDLSGNNVLELDIGGLPFAVSQVICSFALNEIPQASCLLATGRDANSQFAVSLATIHSAAADLLSMQKATITFFPRGEANMDGRNWPDTKQVIFDGIFVGFGLRKVQGHVQVVAHLTHWLLDMGMSSSLSSTSHPINPAQLTFPNLLERQPTTGAGSTINKPVFLPEFAKFTALEQQVPVDMWGGIKSLLCAMASVDHWQPTNNACSGGKPLFNGAAKAALARIEGPSDDPACTLAYTTNGGVPLPMTFSNEATATAVGGIVAKGIASSVGQLRAEQLANMTLWDVLVSYFLPQYGMALVPLVDRAVVIADTPGYRNAWRVTLGPEEYSFMDYRPLISKPLRGVALATSYESRAGAAGVSSATQGIGGCYIPDTSQNRSGTILILPTPNWLIAAAQPEFPARSAVRPGSATDPMDPTSLTPAVDYASISTLYGDYARKLFIDHGLRTRSGQISGRLRFDIAPGSTVLLTGSSEAIIGGVDVLAPVLYANVSRVTIAINSETSQASTSFQFTHVRTEPENTDDRTSTDRHPFYGKNVVSGLPLIPAYLFN